MNERIRQLAEQAGMYVDLNGRPWPRNMSAEESEVAYKKFAQLIVQACASIADQAEPYKASDLIKKHFEVEQ